MSALSLPERVTLVEVGPRDGLQNQAEILSVEDRIEFIRRLSKTGLKFIEAGSFVSPDKVPQMKETDLVLKEVIAKNRECIFPVLTPNMIGLRNAMDAGATHVAVFGSASESFCNKNINCSVGESLERFQDIIQEARIYGLKVRGYLSCIFDCPYEGPIPAEKTVLLAEKLINMGCYEISLGDTIGTGTVGKVGELLSAIRKVIPITQVAVHFHDTYGQALANIHTALEHGVSVIDTAIAGLGGCPYAPGASGNVATEDVLYMLNGLTMDTGVSLNRLIETSHFICNKLNCYNHSKVSQATPLSG